MSAKEKGKFEHMAKMEKALMKREMKTYIPPKEKTKKFKDPNEPEGPSLTLFLFCSEYHPKLRGEHPSLAIGDFTKKLGEIWDNTASDDKQPYEEKAAKLRRSLGKALLSTELKENLTQRERKLSRLKKAIKKKEDEEDKGEDETENDYDE